MRPKKIINSIYIQSLNDSKPKSVGSSIFKKLTCTQTRQTIELKDIGSDISLDPHALESNTQLTLKVLGLEASQTHKHKYIELLLCLYNWMSSIYIYIYIYIYIIINCNYNVNSKLRLSFANRKAIVNLEIILVLIKQFAYQMPSPSKIEHVTVITNFA